MKRLLVILALNILLLKPCFSQVYNYAWITDIQVGLQQSNGDLTGIVKNINNRKDIKFVIVSGNLTESGADLQLETVKEILDSLTVPYYVIPGRRDLEWSTNAGLKLKQLFKDDNFYFNYNGVEHIGLNTGLLGNHYGHVSIDNLKWLDSTLQSIPKDREIILYSFFPVNSEIDNWYEIINRLQKFKIKEFVIGRSQQNKITDYYKIHAAIGKSSRSDKKSWNYNVISVEQDSLFFYSVENSKPDKFWGAIKKDTNSFGYPNSSQFADYSADLSKINPKLKASLLWEKDFDTDFSSSICAAGNKIYLTSTDGKIDCMDTGGKVIWKYSVNEPITGAPVIVNNNLIVGTVQGDLISIDTSSGNVVQSIGLNIPITSQLTILNGEYNGEKTAGVIVGTSKGDLYFYDADSFELIWENHSAKGLIVTKPLIIKDRIIYGSFDGYLYCVDAKNGIINWKWTNDGKLSSSPASCLPVSDGRNVYVVSPDNNVYAIDLMLGQTVWRKNNFNSFESLGISNDKKLLFVKSSEGNFYKISALNGRPGKIIKMDLGEDYLPTVPVEFNDNILFTSQNGNVYFIGSGDKWTKLFYLGNSPLLNIARVNANTFIAGNRDGKFIAFKIE